ncbi:hypothetical protein [Saccharopolyspora sp. NPDC050642]|uniref:hypothetical protein n=1 Tax=Saccharopolyspora sp. NPDC050642 TaxID=3157099 RepID=UPI0033EB6A25
MIPYRHFESKTDLHRAVLERAMARLAAATDVEAGRESAHALLRWAIGGRKSLNPGENRLRRVVSPK